MEMKKGELTHGSLFSGIEGFGLGAALAGIKTEWSCEFEDYGNYVCDMWMPIPSFDQILEANKDVLQRMKEKGETK